MKHILPIGLLQMGVALSAGLLSSILACKPIIILCIVHRERMLSKLLVVGRKYRTSTSSGVNWYISDD